jgi:acetolactate synthase I/II/III large subunit
MSTSSTSGTVQHPDTGDKAPESKGTLTGAQAVAGVIAGMPQPTVFGMPGGYTVQIFDALYPLREQVSVNLVREESLATVMAESFGRLTGMPAVVVGQGAWVLGNAGIGIMEALLGCSPMVLLIDSTDGGTFSHLGPYQAGGGGYGAYDLAAAMRAITKETFVATNPSQAMQMTRLAFKHATTGEMGPVAVIFNGPALYKRLDPKREPPIFASDRYTHPAKPLASQAAIDHAANLIKAAKNPIIIAGNGVRLSKAQEVLKCFAKNHDIAVVTTPAGKGTFAESDPLALGVIGAFGHETANKATGRADLIIALGTKLGASDTANQHPALMDPSRQKFIQIDLEPLNLSWTTPIDAPILGDVCEALERLDKAVGEQHFNGQSTVALLRRNDPYFDQAALKARGDFSGKDAAAVLSEVLPANTIVTCDAGENRLFVLRQYQTKEGGDVLQPNGGGGMGYAVPAAMAAAFTFKDRPAVAVCGDGGISMTLHGLMSAIELGLKMTVVVLDNQVLGWVYSSQRNRTIASELAQFDVVAIARAMGCQAELAQTSSELAQAVTKALAHQGVSLIVAKISKTDRYQDVMSSLHKYDVYSVPENP